MSTEACARCQKESAADLLIPSETGTRICLNCEEELQSIKKLRNAVWLTIVSLPILVAAGFALLCIPYLGVMISFVLAIGAIVASVRAFLLGMSVKRDPEEYGVSSTEPVVLMVMAVLSGLAALGLVGLSLLGIVIVLFL